MANSNCATLLHSCTSKRPNILFTNLFLLIFTSFLCTLFYLLGLWHHYHPITGTSSIIAGAGNSICLHHNYNSTTIAATPSFSKLDFSPHHQLPDLPLTVARGSHLPPCNPTFSEYTPCEDLKRSLKFPRNRLIYRERHCPAPEEILRCRIPAPFGYRLPLRWPASRDSVWYANVPHKELTVEKKKQNWIRFEGDRFSFPGGGTMFARGANTYIDVIGKLINLKDGSIRTAIDTGCGVDKLLEY